MWKVRGGIGARGTGPSLRLTITHGRWSICLNLRVLNGSNDTINGMRCPWCIGSTKPRKIRDDSVNIT